jgi:hypothetical protein
MMSEKISDTKRARDIDSELLTVNRGFAGASTVVMQ